jgi:cellulose synthase/poly-beta-1,6-N-acetylglucosamine synthase-like glycosyltransferase
METWRRSPWFSRVSSDFFVGFIAVNLYIFLFMLRPRPALTFLQLPSPSNKVSIVIPVYQRESYLNRCFHTFPTQSFFPVEVVFVDDGSTDSTPQMLAKYQQTHSNVQVITLQKIEARIMRVSKPLCMRKAIT